MSTLLESDVHQFNLNTLGLDRELETLKIDLLLMPGEIQKRAIVGAQWHTAMDRQVCPLCNSMQGEIIPVDSPEWGRVAPPVHLGCFLSSKIPILTSDGPKGIGDIVVGDKVLTHKNRFRKVLRLFRQEGYQGSVIELTITGIDRFIVTWEHPFLTNKDEWKMAGSLSKGDFILSQLAKDYKKGYIFDPLAVRSVAKIRLKEPKTLYNFAVEEDESYIAKGLVSHNCRCMLSYITADERGVIPRLERYKPVDPDLLKRWSSKIYTDAEIREMAKSVSEYSTVRERVAEFSDKYGGYKTERSMCLDVNGHEVLSKTGTATDINFTVVESNLMKNRNLIFIHNHPGGASFSPDDIVCAKYHNFKEMIAVGSKHRYTIYPKSLGKWPNASDLKIAHGIQVDKYESWFNDRVYGLTGKPLLTRKVAWNEVTHKIWQDLAKDFNLVYERTLL